MKRFLGRVVLVTGGTSGIELALAGAFLREGASVAVCGRSRAKGCLPGEAPPGALDLACDVTDPAAQSTLMGYAAGRFGRLAILVDNAGRLVERDFARHPPASDAIDTPATAQALSRWTGWGGRIRTCECRYQKPRRADRRPQKSTADQEFSSSDRIRNKNRDTNRKMRAPMRRVPQRCDTSVRRAISTSPRPGALARSSRRARLTLVPIDSESKLIESAGQFWEKASQGAGASPPLPMAPGQQRLQIVDREFGILRKIESPDSTNIGGGEARTGTIAMEG